MRLACPCVSEYVVLLPRRDLREAILLRRRYVAQDRLESIARTDRLMSRSGTAIESCELGEGLQLRFIRELSDQGESQDQDKQSATDDQPLVSSHRSDSRLRYVEGSSGSRSGQTGMTMHVRCGCQSECQTWMTGGTLISQSAACAFRGLRRVLQKQPNERLAVRRSSCKDCPILRASLWLRHCSRQHHAQCG